MENPDKKTTQTETKHQGLLEKVGSLTYADICDTIGHEEGRRLMDMYALCRKSNAKPSSFVALEKMFAGLAGKQAEVIK